MKYRKFQKALDTINQAIITFPNFIPALTERAKVYLALQDWEQMIESAKKLVVFCFK